MARNRDTDFSFIPPPLNNLQKRTWKMAESQNMKENTSVDVVEARGIKRPAPSETTEVAAKPKRIKVSPSNNPLLA